MSARQNLSCWICGHAQAEKIRDGVKVADLSSKDFQITDSNYGLTLDIYSCGQCHFRFCPDIVNASSYYVEMEDDTYEATREERSLQAIKLLDDIAKYRAEGAFLDVGAGSGILVEQALKRGYVATGIEPSRALQARAVALNLPVVEGIFPHDQVAGAYDVVTLVDVIEHVSEPLTLLKAIAKEMRDDGVCVVTTPDVASLAAKVMGRRWWHYRLAHVAYFDRGTLENCVTRAGLEIVQLTRPRWYFPADYLARRCLSYLPAWLRFPLPKWLSKVVVPLNLFDSLQVVCPQSE